MSKNKKKRGAAKGGPSRLKRGPKHRAEFKVPPLAARPPVPLPPKESVLQWVRKDLHAAHYLLGLVLTRHPEIVDEMATHIYETSLTKEQGPGIDHLPPPAGAAETGLD